MFWNLGIIIEVKYNFFLLISEHVNEKDWLISNGLSASHYEQYDLLLLRYFKVCHMNWDSLNAFLGLTNTVKILMWWCHWFLIFILLQIQNCSVLKAFCFFFLHMCNVANSIEKRMRFRSWKKKSSLNIRNGTLSWMCVRFLFAFLVWRKQTIEFDYFAFLWSQSYKYRIFMSVQQIRLLVYNTQ